MDRQEALKILNKYLETEEREWFEPGKKHEIELCNERADGFYFLVDGTEFCVFKQDGRVEIPPT
ncbi:MAG: hypothetical protein IJS32_08635 [Kiritimatiellae bacterium]|nr:hypothetical protein [Kiritimatiellia bacterium]